MPQKDFQVVEVAEKAWRRLEDGVHEDFEGRRVVKKGKYVIVMPHRSRWPTQADFASKLKSSYKLVVFPQPEHFQIFEKASDGTARGAPGSNNPGGLGTVGVSLENIGGSPFLEVLYAQAHYKSGDEKYAPSRALVTQYAGWRVHAFEELAKLAREHGFDLHFGRHTSLKERRPVPIPQMQIFKDIKLVSQRLNVPLERVGDDYVLKCS